MSGEDRVSCFVSDLQLNDFRNDDQQIFQEFGYV